MPKRMIFLCLGVVAFCIAWVSLATWLDVQADKSLVVPCSKYPGQSCEMRKECKKCTRCTDASDQCCCLHVDACGCDIFCFPDGTDEDFKEPKSALRLIAPERP